MTTQRKEEVKSNLLTLYDDRKEITMFELISLYNKSFDNVELIGGKWVRENVPELADLP